ncbi:cytochrome P450 CYP5203 [Phycomyces blakesleeanus]|uniref:Cytochrome P450 CYP5203 n=2 Tax=Phycomyces blakesleeanus TaxID=4837 RepID=A0A162WV45_PHYB8|nr:cytochrome P450 CYP5203 [Phycomyces blakesleeanus NRRL 1555(-)]OAD71025.1 cytochrome P450 CYP5203 [Phycomyces blakesleeanus NRRL 1555(-)]|eukprot:XP_018289065.1 cytochrome P450 CYP5203 [Phycomyces blakesleeanus NRRL 1555(-)]
MDVVSNFISELRNKNLLSSNLGVVSTATIGVLLLLALKYPDRAIFTEHRDGVPHEKGLPLVGHLFGLLKNKYRIHDFQTDKFVKLDTMTMTMSVLGIPRTIFTIDPRNVEHVLKTNFENYVKSTWFSECTVHLFGHGILNSNGAQWRWQRKAASLIFNVKNFRDQFTDVFVDEVEILCNEILEKAVVSGEAVDLHEHIFRFTLDSFVYLGFGIQLNSLKTKEEVDFAASFDACQLYSLEKFMNPMIEYTAIIDRILHPRKKTIKQHIETIDNFSSAVISKRRTELANGGTPNDLLSRFMGAKNEKDEPLSDKELKDISLNFIIAGRDTTAVALTWVFYCLFNAPEVEKKLLEEITNCIKDEKKMDSAEIYETIKNMTYAHAVFYEVLRLYPPVPNNQKYALNDDILPDGTHVLKGDNVAWSPYGSSRNKKIWGPDAANFDPERWITLEGNLRRETQGRWSVFNGGPRVCLGQSFATLEALVVIIFLFKRYKFTMLPNQDITYETSLTLPMKNGLRVKVEKRV